MRYAILASLLLHLLLLWPAPLRPPASEARALLQATVRVSRPPPVPAPPGPAPARAVSPAPTPARLPITPAVPSPESPRPLPVAKPPVASAALPTAASSVPTAAAPSAITGNAGTGAALSANPTSAEALDGLRGYRLAIASQARRFKRYPAEARASGWTGSTEVRLEVGAEGQPRPATVSRSSGHEVLDRAALAMIDAGAARARLPDSLRGREFAVSLPVEFRLDEP